MINGMDKFLQTSGEILSQTGHILYIIWTYIQAGFTWLMMHIGEFVEEAIIPVMPTVTKLFNNAKINRTVFTLLLGYVIIINITAFIMYGVDKHNAKVKKHRIKESTLLKVCFWCGAAGSFLGMIVFNHKTAKKKFSIWVPVMFIIQLIAGSFVFGFLSFWTFMR